MEPTRVQKHSLPYQQRLLQIGEIYAIKIEFEYLSNLYIKLRKYPRLKGTEYLLSSTVLYYIQGDQNTSIIDRFFLFEILTILAKSIGLGAAI